MPRAEVGFPIGMGSMKLAVVQRSIVIPSVTILPKKAGASVEDPDVVRWTIEWVAPDRGGPVAFHVAANAADGNESADGDFVYTTTAESPPRG